MRSTLRNTLQGIALVAFLDRPWHGAVVLLVALLIAPFAALGAAIGAVAGILWSRFDSRWTSLEAEAGLPAYNPAIVGLFWGSALARGVYDVSLFPLALLAVLGMDPLVRRFMLQRGLPPLAVAALLVGWASNWVYWSLGVNFWAGAVLAPLGDEGVFAAIALLTAVYLYRDWRSAMLAGGLVLAAVPLGPAGLWAFAVAPAAYALSAVWPIAGPRGVGMAAGGALTAGLVWWLWPPISVFPLPSLVAPGAIAIYATLTFMAGPARGGLIDPGVRKLAKHLDAQTGSDNRAAVLSGAGLSTASGIPDYTSAVWLDPAVPVADYAYGRYLADPRARNRYLAACGRFREYAVLAEPNAGHRALARLQEAGFLGAMITQNVDGLLQQAGAATVIELHGNIGMMRCLKCHQTHPWTEPVSDDHELSCLDCGGLLKPAVIAMGEDLDTPVWNAAMAAVRKTQMVLAIGTRLEVSSALSLTAELRRTGGELAVISLGDVAVVEDREAINIRQPVEVALPALALILTGQAT